MRGPRVSQGQPIPAAKLLGIVVTITACQSTNVVAGTLVSQGQATGSIIYHPGLSSRVTTAITDLANYVQQMSGAQLPIVGDNGSLPSGFKIRIGSTNGVPVDPASVTDQRVGLDGFIIQSVADGIVISGRTPEGPANGIYHYAEKVLGVHWLSPEDNGPTVLHQTTIEIGTQNQVIKPDARWRGQYYSFQQSPNYQVNGPFTKGINANRDRWWIFNRVNSPPSYEVDSGHAFSKIVPQSLFSSHPEYFPLIDYTFGPSSNHLDPYENRIPTGNPRRRADNDTFQRELGNPAVLQMAIDYTRAQFAANPNLKFVSLSANDGPWWSNSPESQALGPTDSARNLAFVNAVATANEQLYPDRGYVFVAYESTLQPPAGMRVHPNVVPDIASLRTGRVHSILSDHPDSVYLRNIVEGWTAISDRIAWHPYMNGGPLTTPAAVTLAEEATFFRDHGSMGGFREHQHLPSVGWAMANWLEVQLMWNADQNPVDLRRGFVEGYYGAATARVVDRIYGDIETRLRNNVVPGDPNAQVEDPAYLKPLIAPSAGAIAVALRASQYQPETYRNRLDRDMRVLADLAMPTVFSDNFDNKTGSLTGKMADTGQAWGPFTLFADPTSGPYGSFDISTGHGLHGSKGAGTNTNDFKGNSVPLGAAVFDGQVQVDMDLQTQAPGCYDSTTPLKQWFLRDSAHASFASIYWESDGDVGLEGLGIQGATAASGMSVNGSMHVSLNIDLDAQTVLFSWFDNDDPNDPTTKGSLGLKTYTQAFAPNVLDIWGRGENNVINSGYDNIAVRALSLPSGDANLDGQVDVSDLGLLATNWQTSSDWTGGDFDFSGFVDISDLGILASNWQRGVASPLGPESFDTVLAAMGLSGVVVPEPASVGILGLGSLLGRRRRAPGRCP